MRSLSVLLALMLSLFSVACGGGYPEAKKEPTGEEKPLIGMSFDSFLIERWQRDRDVFVSTASELGAEVNVQIANGDASEQISQIEYFIKKDVDAIVVVAVDCYGLSDIVQKARDAGIYVISYDRLIMNAKSDLYISFDNEMVGYDDGGVVGRQSSARFEDSQYLRLSPRIKTFPRRILASTR